MAPIYSSNVDLECSMNYPKKMISQFTVTPNTWGTVLKNVGTKWNFALFCSLSWREKTQQNRKEMMDKTYDMG
jgi:hypothetical protein